MTVQQQAPNVPTMSQAEWAEDIARKFLEVPLPRRWAHTQGVAAQAATLAPILGDQADLLEAAAWLHDIGYASDLVVTGFHPLDGARYLRKFEHANGLLCRLVAHHSSAITEADERGLRGTLLRDFAAPPRGLADALTYSDMTTGPDGRRMSVGERLAEIQKRYGPGHVVSRSIRRAGPRLTGATQIVFEQCTAAKRLAGCSCLTSL